MTPDLAGQGVLKRVGTLTEDGFGFEIAREALEEYRAAGGRTSPALWAEIAAAIKQLEEATGQGFGDPARPLLLSVTAGAAYAMPAVRMMTHLGLNDETVEGLAARAGDTASAFDAYRRFLALFATWVLDFGLEPFELLVEQARKRQDLPPGVSLDVVSLQEIVYATKHRVFNHLGIEIPIEPRAQLRLVVEAIFRSWASDRAAASQGDAAIAIRVMG